LKPTRPTTGKNRKKAKKRKNLLFFTYRPKGPNEREKMTKAILNMLFLFCALLVAWNLQDNGQNTAAAFLLLVSLALAFVIQIEKGTK
jgi:phosphotransferase system  glucose/maltose/N-acetylglucosamine-specific IIC component